MAISRLSGQDAVANAATSTVTATYPGATSAGDLLIAVATNNNNTNVLTGWTTLVTGTTDTIVRNTIFYKLATGSETTVTVTASGATIMALDIFEYTGNANPIVADGTALSNDGGSTPRTSWSTPTITTLYQSKLIISMLSCPNSALSGFAWTTSALIGSNTGGTESIHCGQYITTGNVAFSDTATWTTAATSGTLIGAFQASPGKQPTTMNNYQFLSIEDNGNAVMSVSEKIR
jgi:hypothetical protein